MTASHSLTASGLGLGYRHELVIDGLDVEIAPGAITAIVGPNGCGKSTLLRALARLMKPRSGAVHLDGQAIHSQPTKAVARVLGLLPQSPLAPEGIAVADLVSRGRSPHQGLFGSLSAADKAAIAEALKASDTAHLADRNVDELSGGQRQRVWIAMALAQQSDILLLDEPTTFLDVAHQVEVLDLLVDLNKQRGTTVVMVLHDLNLAARYADQLIAMKEGTIVAHGKPTEVVSAAMVKDVFGLASTVIADPVTGAPLVIPSGRHHHV